MKGALANIGKMELSAVALRLETSARSGSGELLISETPAFLDALRSLVEDLKSKTEPGESGAENEDLPYLREKLLAIKAACEAFDENSVDDVLAELRAKLWSQPVKELLGSISNHLLHSDFDEILDTLNRFMVSL
jgi:HPt (histidine-containing phosphotransfer) domain-containing protein